MMHIIYQILFFLVVNLVFPTAVAFWPRTTPTEDTPKKRYKWGKTKHKRRPWRTRHKLGEENSPSVGLSPTGEENSLCFRTTHTYRRVPRTPLCTLTFTEWLNGCLKLSFALFSRAITPWASHPPWSGGNCWRKLAQDIPLTEETVDVWNFINGAGSFNCGWLDRATFANVCDAADKTLVQLRHTPGTNIYHYGDGGRWYRVAALPEGWYGSDPEKLIETSANANASELAKAEAAKRYRQALAANIRVKYRVSEKTKRQVNHLTGTSVAFGETALFSDHPTLACLREVIREVYSRLTSEVLDAGALVVGSSAREVKVYANHPGVEHYFHGLEAKDVERATRTLLARMATLLRGRVSQGEKIERAYTAKQLYDEYGRVAAKRNDNFIHTSLPARHYPTLLFEDSFYNFGWAEYADIFNRTGATQAMGYGLLPHELRWADMPKNDMYSITSRGNRTVFSYRHGESNGYSHDTEKWSTILNEPYRSFGSFALVAEVKTRIGPFVIFSITKTTATEHLSRTVELPEDQAYARVLDIGASMRGALATRKDVYFSVNSNELYEAINFALSLAEKSLSPEAVMTMIRRRAPGVSLTTQQLVGPWSLPEADHYRLAVAAYAYALYSRAHTDGGMARLQESQLWALLKDQFSGTTFWGRSLLFSQKPADILDRLVIPVKGSFDQSKLVRVDNPKEPVFTIRTEGRLPRTNLCALCSALAPKLGKQIVECDCKDKVLYHKFSLTADEVNDFKNEMIPLDTDHPNLTAVKTKAQDAIKPIITVGQGDDATDVQVHYIRGGPGTGKSYIIRQLATPQDLILSPLLALRSDYTNLEDEEDKTADRYDLDFATPHRALTKVNKRRIFVDEFTLIDYRFLAMIAHCTSAQEIYLVGDHGQTHIQEEHGVPIATKIDMEQLCTHNLRVNFRNPIEVVDYLNHNFGYNMIAGSGKSSRIIWANPKTYAKPNPPPADFHSMAFSHVECEANDIPGCTVKTCQGKTFSDVVLFIDKVTSTSRITGMQVVALSRHKGTLTIVAPPSVREEMFPQSDYPEEGFPGERHTRPDTAPEETVVTLSNVLEEENIPDMPIPDKPVLASVSSRSLRVNKWTCYLLAKAAFHLYGELSNAGHFVRLLDLLSTGYLNRSVGANVAPTYFIFLINVFVLRLFLRLAVHYFSWTNFILVWFSPFPVDDTDRLIAHIMTTQTFLYCVNIAGYVIYMYKLWSVARMRDDTHFVWNFHRPQAIKLDLESGRFISYTLPNNFPRWVNLPETFKSLHFLVPWSGYETSKIPTHAEVTDGKVVTAEAKDSHLLLDSLLPKNVNASQFLSALNEFTSLAVKPNFRNGRLRIQDLVAPLNRRGNVKSLVTNFRAFSVGNGVKFWDSPMQTLGVLAERYLTKGRPIAPTTTVEKANIAEQVVAAWFEEHMTATRYTITDADIDDAMSEYIPKAIAKHYPNQAQDISAHDARDIRLHIKQILKPASVMRPVNLDKAGQGISAWHKNAQIILGCGALVVYKKFREGLKEHVLFDNGMTPKQMKDRARQMLATYGSQVGSKNCVADGEMFDANQDEFTQMLERLTYVRLGASEEWVELYMSHRVEYNIITPYARGRAGTEKTSGEPFTLLGNTIVSALISNYIYRGQGDQMLAIKGDDFWKRQVGVEEVEHRVRLINRATRLRMKAYVSDVAEFTGYTIVGTDFIDSVPRKFNKVSGHEFKNYGHFCEYQKSLRDWVKEAEPVRPLLVAANSHLFNLTNAEVDNMYCVINALSHIDERQYMELSREYVRYEAALVGPNGSLAL